MNRVTIAVQPRPYDAVIGSGLLEQAGIELRQIVGNRRKRELFVVTVASVRRRWGKKLTAALVKAGFKPRLVEMPDGERHKQLATVEKLAEKLSRLGAERSALVL